LRSGGHDHRGKLSATRDADLFACAGTFDELGKLLLGLE
jgi:hypothetical protein